MPKSPRLPSKASTPAFIALGLSWLLSCLLSFFLKLQITSPMEGATKPKLSSPTSAAKAAQQAVICWQTVLTAKVTKGNRLVAPSTVLRTSYRGPGASKTKCMAGTGAQSLDAEFWGKTSNPVIASLLFQA